MGLGFTAEDVQSITAVLALLESQAAELDATSKVRCLWRDWSDLLGPAAAGVTDHALDLALDRVCVRTEVTPGGRPCPA